MNTFVKSYVLFITLLLSTAIFAGNPEKNDIVPPLNLKEYKGLSKESPYDQLKKTNSFTSSKQINSDPLNLINDNGSVIKVSDDGLIYIVWNSDDSLKAIYFSRSVDGGLTFSDATKINDDVPYPDSYGTNQPDLEIGKDGSVCVTWHDYRGWANDQAFSDPLDIYFDKSTDGGLTWGTDVKVSEGYGTYPWSYQPYLDIDKKTGNIYITFSDYYRWLPEGDLGGVNIARSIDGGATFETSVRLDDTADSNLVVQSFSSVTVDSSSGNVYAVFQDNRYGSHDVFITKSTDYGLTFGGNVLVNSDTLNNQEEPYVTTDGFGNIYVAWKDWKADTSSNDETHQNNISFAKSVDGGETFSAAITVNDEIMNSAAGFKNPPKIEVAKSGVINLVWHDYRNGFSTCFYDRSEDGGLTFDQDLVVHDNMDSVSHALPRLALDKEDVLYFTWQDRRNGNDKNDIFFSMEDIETKISNTNSKPESFTLWQNYPNPFNPETSIQYTISKPGNVKLSIYDLAGKKIRDLVNNIQQGGTYQITWNGKNNNGQQVSSGLYLYQLITKGNVKTKKMLLLQ